MALDGKGFLAIWHDIVAAQEKAWLDWHTREHMPERIGVPGFLSGRRYFADPATSQRCFTLYQGVDISTFSSPPYLARLDNPTPWTRQVAPAFQNFTRGACAVICSLGEGVGGFVATVRLAPATAHPKPDAARAALLPLLERNGLTGLHLGLCNPEVTNIETAERRLRTGTAESIFGGVLVVEGYDRDAIAAAIPVASDILRSAPLQLAPREAGIYALDYLLSAD